MPALANVALTNTFDTWRVRTNQLVTRINAFAGNESALYANTLTANVRFVSSGATKLGSSGSTRTIVNGLLSANGNLNLNGNTIIGGSGKVANVTGWFGVTGKATISTNLFVTGNATLGSSATNSRITTFGLLAHTGRATISTNLAVSGNSTISGTETVTGLFTASGRAVVGTNLSVTGNTTLGDASTDLTTVNGRMTIAQNLNVSGNTTIGAANKTTNATGWFGVTGRATVSTNLFVGGNTTLNGTTTDRSNALSQTLTDAATITWDTSLGRVATVTLAASRSIAAPTNQKIGTYILRVIQGGTGSYTLTWNGNFKWTAQTAPVLSTAVGAVDVFTFFSDGSKMYGSFLPDVR